MFSKPFDIVTIIVIINLQMKYFNTFTSQCIIVICMNIKNFIVNFNGLLKFTLFMESLSLFYLKYNYPC